MYKIIRNLFVAIACTTSMAAIAKHHCNGYTGVYIGGNAGYGYGTGKLTTKLTRSVRPFTNNLGIRGTRGGLHGGYGRQFLNKTYLGVEASADYSNSFTKGINPDPNSFQSKRRDAYGLALRIGGVLGASMLTYTKFGIESANWKTTGLYYDAKGKFANVSQNKRTSGVVLGIGMETLVTKNIVVGGECAYTIYNKAANVTTLNPVTLGSQRTDTFKPRTADFRLRASYKW